VVLPASGWEMIAKVRRRAISAAGDMRKGLSQSTRASKRKVNFVFSFEEEEFGRNYDRSLNNFSPNCPNRKGLRAYFIVGAQ
jgi:hypothetical protein